MIWASSSESGTDLISFDLINFLMVKKILSIQNTRIETLGNLRNLIEYDGYEILTIQAGIDDIPNDPLQYSAIIILG